MTELLTVVAPMVRQVMPISSPASSRFLITSSSRFCGVAALLLLACSMVSTCWAAPCFSVVEAMAS